MIFALCLLPIVALMGGAIDFSRQRSGEGRAQDAIDAALLAVALGSKNKTEDQLTLEARKWFEIHMGGVAFDIDSFKVVKSGDDLLATVTGGVGTTFLAIMGINELKVKRSATVTTGLTKIELAMVLDTTGSMLSTPSGQSKTKLKSLQDSAIAMVNMLESVSDDGNIEIAVVPFATYVNVGADKRDADWIDAKALSDVSADNLVPGLSRFDLYDHLGYEWKGCVMAREAPYDIRDTAPKQDKPETLFTPMFHPDEGDKTGWSEKFPNNFVTDSITVGNAFIDIGNPMKYGLPADVLKLVDGLTSTAIKNLTGLGPDDCTGSIDKNDGSGNNNCPPATDALKPENWTTVTTKRSYNYYSDVFSTTGPSFSCEMRPITPLTTNYQTVRNEINALKASGSTNIAQGVVWGWHVLSPGEPFKEGDRYSEKVQKVIILLTDGNNTMNTREVHPGGSDFSAYGYSVNERLEGVNKNDNSSDTASAMDDRAIRACKNAKKAGVRVFTIRLSLEDDRSEDLLTGCASNPEDFFDVRESDKLQDAFQQITDRISSLYLSH